MNTVTKIYKGITFHLVEIGPQNRAKLTNKAMMYPVRDKAQLKQREEFIKLLSDEHE